MSFNPGHDDNSWMLEAGSNLQGFNTCWYLFNRQITFDLLEVGGAYDWTGWKNQPETTCCSFGGIPLSVYTCFV